MMLKLFTMVTSPRELFHVLWLNNYSCTFTFYMGFEAYSEIYSLIGLYLAKSVFSCLPGVNKDLMIN